MAAPPARPWPAPRATSAKPSGPADLVRARSLAARRADTALARKSTRVGVRGPAHMLAFPSPHAAGDATRRLGLLLALAAFALLVGPLVGRAVWLRFAGGPSPSLLVPASCGALGAAAALFLLAGNVALRRAALSFSTGYGGAHALPVAAAALGGALALKAACVWAAWSAGLRPAAGRAASLWLAITSLHGAAAAVGAAGVAWLIVLAARRALSPARHGAVRLWATYCHVTSGLSIASFFLVQTP